MSRVFSFLTQLRLQLGRMKARDETSLRGGKFTWVTEDGKQERWIVASCGNYSILFNFRRVKAATAPDARLLEFTEYNHVKKDAQIAEAEDGFVFITFARVTCNTRLNSSVVVS